MVPIHEKIFKKLKYDKKRSIVGNIINYFYELIEC